MSAASIGSSKFLGLGCLNWFLSFLSLKGYRSRATTGLSLAASFIRLPDDDRESVALQPASAANQPTRAARRLETRKLCRHRLLLVLAIVRRLDALLVQ